MRAATKPIGPVSIHMLDAENAIRYPLYLRKQLVTLTLLLDLDDTLLGNDINGFMKAYLGLLAKHLSPYVEPTRMVAALMEGTEAMTLNQRPDVTLEDAFDSVFYPRIGVEKDKLWEVLFRFYQDLFPTLQPYTTLRPEAKKIMETAAERGWQVGIATDPLFPLAAVHHRLSWAGIPAESMPDTLVPGYETFHFAKRTPTFFAEFLGRMGWPEGPVVMVGDSLEYDIHGANLLGIPTYWIKGDNALPEGSEYLPTATGKLEGLLPWIDSQPEEALTPDFSSPTALKAILRATPAYFDHLARLLPEESWRQCPTPDEWCIAEICCHLRDVETEVNLPRLQKMAEEINPFLPGSDTDPWAKERGYIQQDYLMALRDFTRVRMEVLNLLEGLETEDWGRKARHAIFGPTQMLELVQFITGHDRLHIQQAQKALGLVK